MRGLVAGECPGVLDGIYSSALHLGCNQVDREIGRVGTSRSEEAGGLGQTRDVVMEIWKSPRYRSDRAFAAVDARGIDPGDQSVLEDVLFRRPGFAGSERGPLGWLSDTVDQFVYGCRRQGRSGRGHYPPEKSSCAQRRAALVRTHARSCHRVYPL